MDQKFLERNKIAREKRANIPLINITIKLRKTENPEWCVVPCEVFSVLEKILDNNKIKYREVYADEQCDSEIFPHDYNDYFKMDEESYLALTIEINVVPETLYFLINFIYEYLLENSPKRKYVSYGFLPQIEYR